eukprot:11958-Prymnesium_polylepis.1
MLAISRAAVLLASTLSPPVTWHHDTGQRASRCIRHRPPACTLAGVDTFVLPPDDQWPRRTLPAWPPYLTSPAPGQLVCIRGSRGAGASRVLSAESGMLSVQPL